MSSWIGFVIFVSIVCASAPDCVGAVQVSSLPLTVAEYESSPERPAVFRDRSALLSRAVGRVGVMAFMPSSLVGGERSASLMLVGCRADALDTAKNGGFEQLCQMFFCR